MGFLTDWLGKKVKDAKMDTITVETAKTLFYKELALYIAKSYIANSISKCEFKVYESGKEVKDTQYYLWNVNPNPNQSSSQFLNLLINELYDKAHALVVPFKNRMYVAEGFSIDERPMKENLFKAVTIEGETLAKTYKASEVFYFKLDSKSVKKLIDGLHDTYGQLIASAAAAYKRRNGAKYKLNLESMRQGDAAFMEQYETIIKGQLKSFIESDNTVYPQFKGTDLQEFGSNVAQNADDVIKLRKEIFDVTAQAFKIPLPMMYGNITNIQEIVKVFLTFCIDPLADMLGEEITRKTNSFDTWKNGQKFVRVDTSCINHIDIFDIANAADKLISCGAFSIDDLLEVLNRQPLDTEFSRKHWITKNYSDVEKIEQTGGETE